jgi:hypothetical protein
MTFGHSFGTVEKQGVAPVCLPPTVTIAVSHLQEFIDAGKQCFWTMERTLSRLNLSFEA